jgi:hypothetical protein
MAQSGGIATPPGRTWRAYLSTTAAAGQPAVNARDRIGAGPWHNARGQLIANNVADLHGDVQRDRNSINKNFALSEKSATVNGVGDMPNQHDILTGSDSTGRSVAGTNDTTCGNYTLNTDGRGSVISTSRPHRRRQLVVELCARLARLQPAEPRGNGRRWIAVASRRTRTTRLWLEAHGNVHGYGRFRGPEQALSPSAYFSICHQRAVEGQAYTAISGADAAGREVAAFRLRITAAGGLLLTTLGERFLAFAFGGGGSGVRCHASNPQK